MVKWIGDGLIIPKMYFSSLAIVVVLSASVMAKSVETRRMHIPPIARLCGLTVGVNSMEEAERRFGRVRGSIGVHPNSAHSWSFRNGMSLWGDGSEYDAKGLVIDQLELGGKAKGKALGKKLTFMDVVYPGMKRVEVLRLLRNSLPAPHVTANQLSWTMSGYVVVRPETMIYSTWTATIQFSNDRVDWIEVTCDY